MEGAQGQPEIRKVISAKKKDYDNVKTKVTNLCKNAYKRGCKIAEKSRKKYFDESKCPMYRLKQMVLVRYGKKGKWASKKQHVLLGKVEKINKNGCSYKIKLTLPGADIPTTQWFSLEDVTEFPGANSNCEKKASRRKHKERYLIPLTRADHDQEFQRQGYRLIYNPPGDGNCQFSAVSNLLRNFGIHRSPQSLRKELVAYLNENDSDENGWPLELYLGAPFSEYIYEMQQDGTYGDELTLQTMANMYNIEFSVISTLRREGQLTVSPINFQPRGVAVLGHFAEVRNTTMLFCSH